MKMSWHAEGGRLASEWVESEATASYNPAWMQSSYPCQESSRRSRRNPASIIVTIRDAPDINSQISNTSCLCHDKNECYARRARTLLLALPLAYFLYFFGLTRAGLAGSR